MKVQKILLALIIYAAVGCNKGDVQSNQFIPLEGGFGYIAKAQGADGKAIKQGLWYTDSNHNQVSVWPHLQLVWGNNIQINSNLAIFVGGVATTYDDGRERLSDRLIAFKAPNGPPIDVTDRILEKYCLENGIERTNVINDSFSSLETTNGLLFIEFGIIKRDERGPGSINAYGATDMVSWSELDNFVENAKQKGEWKTEKWSGVRYLTK